METETLDIILGAVLPVYPMLFIIHQKIGRYNEIVEEFKNSRTSTRAAGRDAAEPEHRQHPGFSCFTDTEQSYFAVGWPCFQSGVIGMTAALPEGMHLGSGLEYSFQAGHRKQLHPSVLQGRFSLYSVSRPGRSPVRLARVWISRPGHLTGRRTCGIQHSWEEEDRPVFLKPDH
jgi:hypothetical protein